MIEIFKNTHYDFLKPRRIAYMISGAVILIGLLATLIKGGPNYSIDFTGGLSMQVRFEQAVPEGEVRSVVNQLGYNAEIKSLSGHGQQDVLIRIPAAGDEDGVPERIEAALKQAYPGNPLTIRSVEAVGPKIGNELRDAALLAVVMSMLLIVVYLSWRFRYRFAIAALAALTHDVLVVFGLFVILDLEISLSVIAAFLTLVGYSLNDTIVVFDRIRENTKKLRTRSFYDQINISVNETLSRTILTSGTTLLVIVILYFFGGAVIHDFAFALLAGIIVGTYSSVYVANPILLDWENARPEKRTKRRTA